MTTSMSMAARPAVFGHLLQARHELGMALESLTANEAYLRDELERQLGEVQVLLYKMERGEALARDRDFLQMDFSGAGIGEWIGDTDE